MKKRSIALILCALILCSLLAGCMQSTAPTDETPAPVQSAAPTAAPSTAPQETATPTSLPRQSSASDAPKNEKTSPSCTFSIECSTILNNLDDLKKEKLELIPASGVILAPMTVEISEGESVFDVLQRVCRQNNIQLEATWTPGYNSAYVEGIYNLYEFDCGELSGWTYKVNGISPNYGCSSYILHDGDVVSWHFTCALDADV